MSISIVTRIDRQLEGLSRSERLVGSWILENPRRAVDASIMEVATSAEVSEPTVIRFCRSMGTSGYREFRTQLIAALQRPESYLHHDVDSNDTAGNAAQKVLESSLRALIDLRELVSGMPFDDAVAKMAGARQLVFVGVGASGIVAQDACHKFFRLGVPCTTALDSQTIFQQASIARPEDIFIAISHTGLWLDLTRGLNLAAERGATIIALTDPHAPLAQTASIVFDCHPVEDTNVFTPMTSRLAPLVLLDALQVGLAIRLGDNAMENLKLTKEALAVSREGRSI